ncbi:NlpC/P60 family protein [Latilactobacillus curvatus]|uniref:C40 family peptidase n=1 Tax=Latilactobacillus curvatus TaxID=28038 RepID=UPI0024B9767B|nr:C40 family peptidase [Latilactobacillus curvatus]WHQ78183.1 NlpC/P60 family protein [Latilactobacillus curvatus]
MKKVSRLMFSALAFLTIGSTMAVSIGAVSADEVADTKASMTNLSAENSALLAKLSAAQNKVASIDSQVSNKTVAIDDAQKNIASTDKEITEVAQKIVKVQAEVQSRKAVLKEQVIALQKRAGDSVSGNVYVDFIVNSDSFSDMVSRASVVGKLNQANKEAMDAVANSESKLATLKQEQVTKKANLVNTKAQLEKDQAQLTSLKADVENEQASFQQEVDGHKTQLASLQSQLDAQTAAAVEAAKKETEKATIAPTVAPKTGSDNTPAPTVAPKTGSDNTPAPTPVKTTTVAPSGANTGSLVGNALQFIGTPYAWGGAQPGGFDCSGLVWYAAKMAGISLPRTSQEQSTVGTKVSLSELQPGDLVFWGGVGSAHHVGIYIGGGSYVHAPTEGQNVTTMSMQYYKPDFGRRL